jgi:hypothetical protein
MIRYRYANQVHPPAPFVNIALRCPATGTSVAAAVAQLDFGADRTVLTGPLVSALGLVEDGRAQFQGFAGEIIELPLFLVEIQIHDFPSHLVRIVLGEHEPYMLLGRDVLNRYRIVLDGPNQALEIEGPA